MGNVLRIRLTETVRVDQEQLGTLYAQLGEAGAEDIVCRAMEEMALRLSHCNRLYTQGDWDGLRKSARSLVAIADQVGMGALSAVAQSVSACAAARDPIASGATLARLLRVGEFFLTEMWELQDVTI